MSTTFEDCSSQPSTPDAPRVKRKRSLVLRLGVSFATTVAALLMLEFAARSVIDRNGMNYGVEMWKYAKQLKRVSANYDMGHEHKPNSRALLMGQEIEMGVTRLPLLNSRWRIAGYGDRSVEK